MTDLVFKSARSLVDLIRNRELSAGEVMTAFLRQIDRVNPTINAICTLCAEQALEQAKLMDQKLARGEECGLLCGLPVAIKDLTPTKDIPTSYGSPIYKGFMSDMDALYVERLKSAGAVVIGKTNTPEFGAGSHTFNTVFGATCNPYDHTKTAGGSSGGAGAALASGMLPIADGTDMGGSVRNPANFNGVVGLRPSPGIIPHYPSQQAWDTLAVTGPMARNVGDTALMLQTMAGADHRDPISIDPRNDFAAEPLYADLKNTRVAWSENLDQFPVQRMVIQTIEKALPVLTGLGCIVEQAHPDFSGARDAFQILRAHAYVADHLDDLNNHRAQLKDTVIWNIEQGLKLSAQDVSRAETERVALYRRVQSFFDRYDFLLLPVSQVLPFPIEIQWVKEIEGVKMETYIDWMMSCAMITLTAHPAISVPCGFSGDGLPVGVQIVGRYRDELNLLKFAHEFERTLQLSHHAPKPILERSS